MHGSPGGVTLCTARRVQARVQCCQVNEQKQLSSCVGVRWLGAWIPGRRDALYSAPRTGNCAVLSGEQKTRTTTKNTSPLVLMYVG